MWRLCARFRPYTQGEEQAREFTGTIPSWLNGSLVANGGGNYEGQVCFSLQLSNFWVKVDWAIIAAEGCLSYPMHIIFFCISSSRAFSSLRKAPETDPHYRWLQNTLIKLSPPPSLQLHLFDGLAMITKLRIADGKVWASQKYLNSEQYR